VQRSVTPGEQKECRLKSSILENFIFGTKETPQAKNKKNPSNKKNQTTAAGKEQKEQKEHPNPIP